MIKISMYILFNILKVHNIVLYYYGIILFILYYYIIFIHYMNANIITILRLLFLWNHEDYNYVQ